MRKNIVVILAVGSSVLALSTLWAQDATFVADNLKYSRDFYSKVHFVAIAELPEPFKYDQYPSGGPERIQSDAGTYLRQSGKPWTHVDQKMRSGLPIDYAERDRYFMTFALKDDWGRMGEPVNKDATRKLDGWIKLVDAALNAASAAVKLVDKSETEGKTQWIFEAPSENPDGVPIRFTFRKPISDKTEKVLLHEFSGSLRLEGDKVASGGAADRVRFGFGYMMRGPEGPEVSERVWEEMQQAREEKGASGEEKPESPATADDFFNRARAKNAAGDLDGAIADYNRAIQLDPKDAAIYNNRGLTKQAKGELDAAIVDFNRAIQLNPKDAVAYINRGNARDEKGDLEGAIADYNRGIELNPKDSKAYHYRADVHAKKKEYDAAVMDTLKAIELEPKNGDYYLSLGW